MPLPLPNLDDRTFADLSVELRSLIPRYDKTWTNHNPSDPGITLIELFAWLAEILLYRMNRIEKRNYLKFLELIGVQPVGPQAIITFEVPDPDRKMLVLARGTRVAATDEKSGEKIIFETTTDVPCSEENRDEVRELWILKAPAVNTIEVRDEFLGYASGKPCQELEFGRGPVFLDQAGKNYGGNPRIFVETGGAREEWLYSIDLLAPVDSLDPDPEKRVILNRRFTVEPLAGIVRFGDGPYGAIPPDGAKISCTYRKLGGSEGNVGAFRINEIIDDQGSSSYIYTLDPLHLKIFNEYPASGGVDDENLDDMLARGLTSLQERTRAVSEEDFEALAKQAVPDNAVARAIAVADSNLEGTTPDNEGHVSVILLPTLGYLGLPAQPVEYHGQSAPLVLNRTTDSMNNALSDTSVKKLFREIHHYLDERRLITTIVHVVGPPLARVSLEVTLQAKAGMNTESLRQTIAGVIAGFLDPYEGWQDKNGWPYGRDVYRSELYQLLESVEGVDHVTELVMNGDAMRSFIGVSDNSLVCLDELTVTVSG